MRISMIAAMSENRVIGKDNHLPWHLPEELKYFRKMTRGKPIIMGRKTFESMGSKPLPNRRNIILTRDLNFSASDCLIAHSLEQALILAMPCEEVMIIGGSHIYQAFLSRADRLYLTTVHQVIEGDTFFPKFEMQDWSVIEQISNDQFTIQVLDKK